MSNESDDNETVLGPLRFGRDLRLSEKDMAWVAQWGGAASLRLPLGTFGPDEAEQERLVDELRRAMERYPVDPPFKQEQIEKLAAAMYEYRLRMPDLLRPLPPSCFDEGYLGEFRARRHLSYRTFEQEYLGVFVGDEETEL